MRNFIGSDLSRREAQIMEILYRLGSATAAGIERELPDPPGYSTVRKLLEVLRHKGHVEYVFDGPRHLYFPAIPQDEAQRSALAQVVRTFFAGAPSRAVEALLETGGLHPDELDRIIQLARKARKEGR
jgi:predicted transcriptional regulator